MPNLVQVADDLKNMPDQWLAQQAQQPTGEVPPYLVVTELARRERMRSGAEKAKAPQTSVSQDLIRSLYARVPPTTGLAAPGAGAPSGAPAPPGMPPPNLSPGNQGMGPPAPGTPPANMRMPKTMAYGGAVDDDDGYDDGSDDDDEQRRKRERDQLFSLPTVRPSITQSAPPATMAAPGAAPPAAGLPSVPGFAPMAAPPAGSAGKDIYGRPLPVREMPKEPVNARNLYNERERTYQLATKEPEDQHDAAHVDKIRDYLTALYGKEPDTKDLQKEMDYLRAKAEEDKPTVSRMLLRFGAVLMANPSQHFGQALGEANLQSLNWVDQQRQQQRQMELTRLKVMAEKTQREQAFKMKIASEVAQAQDAAERRAQAQQQRNVTGYQHANDAYNREVAGYQKAGETAQKEVQTSYINSLNHTLNHASAVAGLQSADPQVVKYSQDFLNNEQSTRAAEEHRKQNEQTVAQGQRQTAVNTEWDRRHGITRAEHVADDANKPKAGQLKPKTTWTDADTTSDARGFVQEQLDHITKDPNGEGFINEDGKPVYTVDGTKPATSKAELLSVAKKRASEGVRNEEYFADFPRFKINPNERQRVSNRIVSVPIKEKEVSVGARFKQPRGFGTPGQPQQQQQETAPAAQPAAAKPAPQQAAAPAPPKELADKPGGFIYTDENGYRWAKKKDGSIVPMGSQ